MPVREVNDKPTHENSPVDDAKRNGAVLGGLIETYDSKSAEGWVHVAADAPPVKVSLSVNGRPVISTWAIDPEDRHVPGSARKFRFNYRQLWSYLTPSDVVTFEAHDVVFPIVGQGYNVVPAKVGSNSAASLFDKLEQGYVFNQKGKIQLSKTKDTRWQAEVMELYGRVSKILKDDFNLDLFACYGTMLGVVRQGTFIGHDHDFDSAFISNAIDGPNARKDVQRVAFRLIEKGYKVEPQPSALWVSHKECGDAKIDIFHLYFDANGVLQFPFGFAGTVRFKQQNFTGFHEALLAGKPIKIIADEKAFLSTVYGSSWETPNPGFHWLKDRKGRAGTGRLTELESSEIYWSNFYAHVSYDKGSTFQEYVNKSDFASDVILDIGCGDGRDSFAFAKAGRVVTGIDRSPVGVSSGNKKASSENLKNKLTFIACDVSDADKLAQVVSDVVKGAGSTPVCFYSRFFLHSITDEIEATLMSTISNGARSGDIFTAEFRTAADELLTKVHGNHFRRYVNTDAFCHRLTSKYGFEILIRQEGNGFSPYKGEDPILCRIVARKGI